MRMKFNFWDDSVGPGSEQKHSYGGSDFEVVVRRLESGNSHRAVDVPKLPIHLLDGPYDVVDMNFLAGTLFKF